MRFQVVTAVSMLIVMLACGCAKLPEAGEQAQADLLLLAEFEQAARAAVNTPAMESTFHAAGRQNFVQMLRRAQPATEAELAAARRYFQKRLEQAQAGPTWPTPPTFDIPFAAASPRIDGVLDDPAWQNAASFDQMYRLGSTERAPGATVWKVLWDRQYLYFAFECGDADVQAPTFERDGSIYSADCVEMFILPRLETGIYWEIIISPSGSVYDGLQAKKMNGWGPVTRPEFDMEGLKYGVQVRGTLNDAADRDAGYSVEVAVPFAQLPEYHWATPQAGQTIRLMLVRLDGQSQQQLSVYSFIPLLSWGHNLWNHAQGRLIGP